MALPVLSGIFLVLRAVMWPALRLVWWLLKRKLWFFVSLVAVFLGPLQFIGDAILWALSNLLGTAQSFEQAGSAVNLTGWQSAIASIGAGADMVNCVIDLNTYIKVASILWLIVCLQVSWVSGRFLYSLIPGKAT